MLSLERARTRIQRDSYSLVTAPALGHPAQNIGRVPWRAKNAAAPSSPM